MMIANDSMPEFLYHNDGGGKFGEVGLISEVALETTARRLPAWAWTSATTTMTAGLIW